MSSAGLSRLAFAVAIVVAAPLPAAELPHYQVVTDYGTLGGNLAFFYSRTHELNAAGEIIYQAETATPDPVNLLNFGLLIHGVAATPNRVADLGTPLGQPDRDNSYPVALADNGLVTGIATNGEMDTATGWPQLRAVLWQAGHAIALGDLGGHGSQGWAVNNAGMVAGVALDAVPNPLDVGFYGLDAATRTRAFVWRNGTMEDIGTLGGPNANAMAINDAGQVAGNSMLDANVHAPLGFPTIHPFLWQNGRMRDLGTLGGTLAAIGPLEDFFGSGQALNRRGQIAGTSTLAGDTVAHAFLWTDGRMQDLGTLGGRNSHAYAINDNGDVVGRSSLVMTSSVYHAFFWHDGHMTDLGTLPGCLFSKPMSVNNHGDSVGFTEACNAFLSIAGGPMVDINDLIVGDPGMVINEAFYINDAGDIAATAVLPSGEQHAVLLKRTSATAPTHHVTLHVRPIVHGGVLGPAHWR